MKPRSWTPAARVGLDMCQLRAVRRCSRRPGTSRRHEPAYSALGRPGALSRDTAGRGCSSGLRLASLAPPALQLLHRGLQVACRGAPVGVLNNLLCRRASLAEPCPLGAECSEHVCRVHGTVKGHEMRKYKAVRLHESGLRMAGAALVRLAEQAGAPPIRQDALHITSEQHAPLHPDKRHHQPRSLGKKCRSNGTHPQQP